MNIATFRSHIKTRLGSPAINVELDNSQIDIYIDDAVKKFIETHYDGLDEGYIFLDLEADTQEYTLSTDIHSVISVKGITTNFIDNEPLLINPFIFNGNLTTIPDVLDIEIFRQSYSMYSRNVENEKIFNFNSTTHILSFPKIPTINETVAVLVHKAPSSLELIYENIWVKKYATALCKYAWGQNLSKYVGATLPGGVSLNYDRIIDEAKEEITKLEEELYSRYQNPCTFFWG